MWYGVENRPFLLSKFVANFVGGPSGGQFEKIKQPNTIFISGLPVEVTTDQLKDHFGAIGRIKVQRIVITPVITVFRRTPFSPV